MAGESAPGIEILLATYNGHAYLAAQLESLFAQDDRNFTVTIRDDGSQDGTPALLEAYATTHPGVIRILVDSKQNQGACGNFSSLLTRCTASYAMLCDQDDVWHADKVARTRQAMSELERRHGATTPLMVFADARVVSAELTQIAPSFARYQSMRLGDAHDYRLNLLQNCAAGCTIMVNRALMDLCAPIPAAAVLHDHWITLTASLLGHIAVIDRPLLDYRQHAKSVVGAVGMRGFGLWRRFSRLWRSGFRNRLLAHVAQAEALISVHQQRLSSEQCDCLRAFIALPGRSWPMRRLVLLRYGIHMTGFLRNVGLFATV